MSAEYRSAPRGAPPDVVDYRPLGRLAPYLVALALLAFMFGIFMGVIVAATTTDVACGRSEGTQGGSCIVTTSRPLLGRSTRIIPLSSIMGVDVRRTTSKGTAYYQVVLITPDGEVSLSAHDSSDGAARERVRRQLQTFLEDPQHPSIEIAYDVGSPAYLWILALELLPAYLGWLVFQRVTVVFDWTEKRLRIVRTRWPFGAWKKSLRLDEVLRASLVAKPGSKRSVNYSVVLDLQGGERQPLSNMSSSSAKPHERAIAEINALLARRESVPTGSW